MTPSLDRSGAKRPPSFLLNGGEMGARMREYDWSTTALGPPETWPQSLKSMVGACLNSPLLGAVLWGPELLMFYNDAYVQSLADRHPAAMGRPVADVWGAAWQQVAEPFRQAMETGCGFEQKEVEIPMVRRGKAETTWWDFTATPIRGEDGSVVGLLNQGVEITDQVHFRQGMLQAEEELQALNQTLECRIAERTAALVLYQNIVQSNKSCISAFDLDYRLIAFNPAQSDQFFRIFGHRLQLGEVFPDLFPADQASVVRSFIGRALAGESHTVYEEFGDPELAKPSWEIDYSPLLDASGQIMGAFHRAKDISDRLLSQAELLAAQEALRQSQKMESVGQLTGGIAHDFNNLLGGMTGSLELIKRRCAKGEYQDIERYVSVGLDAAQRATALTKRLLAFSRRQALEPKVLDTPRVISGMEDLIRRTIGVQIELEVVPGVESWKVKADAGQLENALLNLCINARDAMPDGGKLIIETANRRFDDRSSKVIDIEPGQYVSLSVSDNGVGMPPEVAAHAFDPFFTTKPIGEGTGLGLSMIYGFAKQSGGHARIYSETGKGTTVCIYLPRYIGADVESTVTPESPPPDVRGQGQVILIVDDEASVRLFVCEILTDLGYKVLEARDGTEAQRIVQSDKRIDLLISDVGLPGGMNGKQVADVARSVRPNLQVLFITGYAENAVLSHGHLEAGMHVMTKPFEVNAFASRVKSLLNPPETEALLS